MRASMAALPIRNPSSVAISAIILPTADVIVQWSCLHRWWGLSACRITTRPSIMFSLSYLGYQFSSNISHPSVSIKHLCPLGTIKKCSAGSMSLSLMPSRVEMVALGNCLKKRVVMRRSSIRARCLPRHANDLFVSLHPPGRIVTKHARTYFLHHHQRASDCPSSTVSFSPSDQG